MENKLKQYFPMLKSREEILKEIDNSIMMTEKFYSWKEEEQQEFLDCCTGVKGVKLLYDVYFKEIMNPETVPERLKEFLSVLLKQNVKIMDVLPGDATRLSDECSLLIMDILMRFEDGTYCNVEVQKIGYAFPGERCACYSADLLLRQYKRVRGQKKKHFKYKDIKGVYTIVLFEKSPVQFHKYPDVYTHYFCQKSNTGLEMNLLQNYVFIPLDIFSQTVHNNGIRNLLEAWLVFLSTDSPELMISLITEYPKFKVMYEHLYYICQNVERMMEMYSAELKILDRNTVQYMVDQMQEAIDSLSAEVSTKQETIELLSAEVSTKQESIDSLSLERV